MSKQNSKNHSSYDKYSKESYSNKIMTFLLQGGRKPVSHKELAAKCRSNKGNPKNYSEALKELIESGDVVERKRGYARADVLGYFTAKVMRLNRTFGFIEREDSGEEIFVPGKFLSGAMPGDMVLAGYIPSRSGNPEGEVISVLKPANTSLSGVITAGYGTELLFLADSMSKTPVKIVPGKIPYKEGDKVLCDIVYRGRRHGEHKASVIFNFGSADRAYSCAMAIIAENGISVNFPENILYDAKKIKASGVWEDDIKDRLDLRNNVIFTIDSAESKDLDDAVSLEKTKDGYKLGVHIADVSHYVKGNSPLDKEAFERGTSIYYADKVIPMLPKDLSNGICSLNPLEDRLAFSVFINLSDDGYILNYRFVKTVIRSKVKGVYSEINSLLKGNADEKIEEKYKEVKENIFLMKELADKLIENRQKRGAPEIETSESKLIIKNEVCENVMPRTRGKSEMIIEEFMLTANEAAARLAREKSAPFVFRVHEPPAPEKITDLKDALRRLNIPFSAFSQAKPAHLAEILKNAKDKDVYPIVNMMTLRSMSKAKYEEEPKGHFGLALEDYAHFTSPIRRYPDLAIHRILTDIIKGADEQWLNKRYSGFVKKASAHSTEMEIKAMNIERDCEDCYKAEYMHRHLGEVFEGFISSVTEFGFYVELPNTIEGLVHINSLPEGYYVYDGYFSLSDEYSSVSFSVGQKVRVTAAAADVNSGNIDFELAEETE